MVPMISTVASYPYSEILAQLPATDDDPNHNACTGDGGVFFQLYVDRDRRRTARLLYDLLGSERGRHNVRAIFVTVDLPVVSKREGDERARAARTARAAQRNAEKEPADKVKPQQTQAPVRGGIAKQTGAFIDPSFAWEDLKWLRTVVDGAMAGGKQQLGGQPLPIVVKGIQRADDARRALAMGCQGIVLSNHGGRAADSAPPAILTLLELHRCCPEVFGRLEIFVDGGFRRGSDVVKAICLGASAVGVGRPFIYSVGYGQAGVDHAAAILEDEIQTAMQLCGITHLMRDAHPDFVNTGDVDHLVSGNTHPYARKPVWPAKL
ncbi:mitochondrial fmn-dependent dehydrogenase [Niveomyces insectorum RCEF 264]|uniref:Mitochondrial fmn-dependent dehydrogenase n=1 Tax=Niveomyces insectorum RCEF 264 TaxID=1081102 RepID=A0A167RCJ5_9HYPO|nr:mitochondrial fmn-dependent dehydrogenase [Niveomyces insectorum RCEF 264]